MKRLLLILKYGRPGKNMPPGLKFVVPVRVPPVSLREIMPASRKTKNNLPQVEGLAHMLRAMESCRACGSVPGKNLDAVSRRKTYGILSLRWPMWFAVTAAHLALALGVVSASLWQRQATQKDDLLISRANFALKNLNEEAGPAFAESRLEAKQASGRVLGEKISPVHYQSMDIKKSGYEISKKVKGALLQKHPYENIRVSGIVHRKLGWGLSLRRFARGLGFEEIKTGLKETGREISQSAKNLSVAFFQKAAGQIYTLALNMQKPRGHDFSFFGGNEFQTPEIVETISIPQISLKELPKKTLKTSGKVLGESILSDQENTLSKLVDERLRQYLAEGKFKGEKGEKGEKGDTGPQGAAGSSLQGGGWSLGYVNMNNPGGTGNGTIGSFTYFSSDKTQINVLNVSSQLNVSGSANFTGTVSFATTTLGGIAYAWPGGDGSANQVLVTNGLGQLSWANISVAGATWSTSTGNSIYYNSGNVGIGTSTPTQKLEVVGNIQISNGNSFILTRGTGTNRDVSFYNSSLYDNIASLNIYPTSGTNVKANLMVIPKGTGYNSTNKADIIIGNTDYVSDPNNYEWLALRTRGSDYAIYSEYAGTGQKRPINIDASNGALPNGQLYLATSGNVGIGTTSPIAKLDVYGNLNVATGSAPALFVNTATGKVGIGNNSPSRSLDITNGSPLKMGTASDYVEYLQNSINIWTWRGMSASTFMLAWNNSTGNIGTGTTTLTNARFTIQGSGITSATNSVYVANASGTPTFIVQDNGNVGIGTTSPGYLLDVNGNIRTTGYIRLPTGIGSVVSDDGKTRTFYSSNAGSFYYGSIHSFKDLNTSNESRITPGGVSYFTVSQLGIGETAPGSKLSVYGGMSVGADTAYSQIAAPTDGMIIKGNVGIGTTSPSWLLTVSKANSQTLVDASANRFVNITNTDSTDQNTAMLGFSSVDTSGALRKGPFVGAVFHDRTASVAPGDLIFGASTNDALTERMRITSTGNVGIGTTSPQANLEIYGTGAVQKITNTSDSNFGDLAFFNGTYIARISQGGTSYSGMGGSNALNIWNVASAPIAFGTANTERVRINSDGNVGIGTTGPVKILDIQAATADIQVKSTTATNYVISRWINGSNQLIAGVDRSTGGIFGTGSLPYAGVLTSIYAYPLQFGTNNTIRMTIDSANGNVGIGTTSPTYQLDIQNSSSANDIRINNSLGSNKWLDMYSNSTLMGSIYRSGNNLGIQSYTGNGHLLLNPTANNVGIGTTSPIAKLDVYGNLNVATSSTSVLFANTGTSKVGIGTSTPGDTLHIVTTSAFGGFTLQSTNDVGMNIKSQAGNGAELKFTTQGLHLFARANSSNLFIGNSGGVVEMIGINGSVSSPNSVVIGRQGAAQSIGNGTLLVYDGTAATGVTTLNIQEGAGQGATSTLSILANNGTTTRLTVLGTSGNVGIGTGTPLATLHVQGSGSNSLFTISSSTGAHILTVFPSGNVGIGAVGTGNGAAPNSKLYVTYADGSANSVTNGLTLNNVAGQPGNFVGMRLGLYSGNDTSQKQFIGAVQATNGSGGTGDIVFLTITNGGSAYQQVAAADEKMRITNYGNVGIGTTAPAALLHVETSSSTWPLLKIATSTNQGIFYINSNGNVGVGTTSPAGNFVVQPSANSVSTARFLNSAGTGIFTVDTTNSQVVVNGDSGYGLKLLSGDIKQAATSLTIETINTYPILFSIGGYGEAMRVNTGGNVGIGTTSPLAKLDVWGNLNVATSSTSTFYVNTATGKTSINALLLPALAGGGMQCLRVDNSGNVITTGIDCGASGGSLAGGVKGYVATWASSTALTVGALMDNGTVSGVNATTSTVSFLVQGTGTLNPFQVNSSTGTSLLTVTPSGNVGIGTTSPLAKLDVVGTIRSNAWYKWEIEASWNTFDAGGTAYVSKDGAVVQHSGINRGLNTYVFDKQGNLLTSWNNDIYSSPSAWNTWADSVNARNNGEVVVVVSSDAVSAPVTGGSAESLLNSLGSVELWRIPSTYRYGAVFAFIKGNYGIIEKITTTTTLKGMIRFNYFDLLSASNGKYSFDTNDTNVQSKSSYFGNAYVNGYLGVKKANPLASLHIGSTGTGANLPTYTVGSSSNDGLLFNSYQYSSDSDIQYNDIIGLGDQNAGAGGSMLRFLTNNTGTDTASVRMVITRTGNVGIGTTVPDMTLLVNGAAGFAGISGNPSVKALQIGYDTGANDRGYLTSYGASAYRKLWVDASQMDFAISGTSKVKIDTNGNVGIGTTGPGQKLDVVGASGTIGSGGARAMVVIRDSTAQATGVGSGIFLQGKYTDAGDYTTFGAIYTSKNNGTTGDSGASLNFLARENGDNVILNPDMTISTTGNVGIGTTSPLAKLDIPSGNIYLGASGNVFNRGYTQSYFGFSTADLAIQGQNKLTLGTYSGAGETGIIAFSPLGTEKVRIDSTGNVGIGTTSPQANLEVGGAGSKLLRVVSSNDNAVIRMDRGSTSGAGMFQYFTSGTQKWFVGVRDSSEQFRISDAADGSDWTGTARLVINKTDGNVGIGTTSPGNKLDVYGNIGIGAGSGGTIFGDTTTRLLTLSSSGSTLGFNSTTKIDVINNQILFTAGGSTSRFNASGFGIGGIPANLLDVFGGASIGAAYAGTTSPSNGLIIQGNVGIGTTTPTLGPLTMASGAYVTAGGTWTNASDRNIKENFATVTPASILEKIVNLPIAKWNYKREDASITHLGPTAQDFYAAFGLGGSDTSISTIDPSGVALVGIQALNEKFNSLQQTVSNLQNTGNDVDPESAIVFKTHLYLSQDSVGQAKILAGSKRVTVTFAKPYEYQPVVTATPLDFVSGAYRVASTTAEGFTIELKYLQDEDITFNYHAFASPEAKLTVSDGTMEEIKLIVPQVAGASVGAGETQKEDVNNSPSQLNEANPPESPDPIIDQPPGDSETITPEILPPTVEPALEEAIPAPEESAPPEPATNSPEPEPAPAEPPPTTESNN